MVFGVGDWVAIYFLIHTHTHTHNHAYTSTSFEYVPVPRDNNNNNEVASMREMWGNSDKIFKTRGQGSYNMP